MLPATSNYLLKNGRVPESLLEMKSIANSASTITTTADRNFCLVDLEIANGAIAQIIPTGTESLSQLGDIPMVDLQGGLIFPCFVDMHAHLDKGHIWERSPNPDGTFASAIDTVHADAQKYWNAEDVYRRMQFGLQCSYAHGTKAIRTHIDSAGEQGTVSLAVFTALQAEWRDRLILQAVSLVSLDYFLTPEGEKLADKIAQIGGILGGVAYMNPDLDKQLDRVFSLAQERGLNLDFHTDETDDPESTTLREVAKTAIRHEFAGQIICGHCCSLAVQPPDLVTETLTLVKEENIGIVSLPMCNLYLQDRQSGRTPRWRGVTVLHELKAAGIPVAVASDNCRDPFYGFGDHDVLEVLNMAARIAHLDRPWENWPRTVTTTPADLMGLPNLGRIGVGLPADLILFKARNFSELLSRSQRDRTVLRQGRAIDTTLPDYRELDDLLHENSAVETASIQTKPASAG
ncbi:MAG: cytosine deaminase [Microcoleus sp. PH2017_25_DOB_D_A]|uniref:cytosine deaminase n=1 Tax=unclassified Microcoleus TaxID=2642155 RepID=UPI001D2FA042|nr:MULTISPECIES: cytosine deaminase [unclassified Microcoleus]TAE13438.1 MAG: cytosine deaminase [Oscillatoriales cyanobacterium]MCC3534248.1 cytosine deaminase [Microcoleus sp. PH2017_25_DOB_D_A]MCC3546575.1 cytosine deaminase [Microcoleus sp. PH2017_24_DOB_U_A]TAE25320.1 MAG: cytosine deaminase [Oscillatoriales cyanobacterium]TAE43926.1 MAG: cytosine deaminase [Oscillatoriales cyanobacterium]